MRELPIKRCLSEDTRLGAASIKNQVYDLHKGLGDDSINYYITKHADPGTIYAVFVREIYESIFNQND